MKERDNQDWSRILQRLGVATTSDGTKDEAPVRLGLPPVDNPPLVRRYANEERWDWWKQKID